MNGMHPPRCPTGCGAFFAALWKPQSIPCASLESGPEVRFDPPVLLNSSENEIGPKINSPVRAGPFLCEGA